MENLCAVRCRIGDCGRPSRYECPRCAIKFCSVPCYGQHSRVCVQAFSANADESLRHLRVSERDRKSSNRSLRAALEKLDEAKPFVNPRFTQQLLDHVAEGRNSCYEAGVLGNSRENRENSEEEDDDDRADAPAEEVSEIEEIADVLHGLVEEMEVSGVSFEGAIARLPKHMRDEFFEMVHDGRIGRLLPVWSPWWLHRPLVEEKIVEDPAAYALPPKPELSDLSCPIAVARAKAGSTILFSVADVVYSYCLMMRTFDGDWEVDCSAAAKFLREVCAVLSAVMQHMSLEDGLNHCMRNGLQATGAADAAKQVIADTSAVFGGRKDWVSRALWEVHRILGMARTSCKGDDRRCTAKQKMKVGFLLSWCLGADDDVFVATSREISSFLVTQDDFRKQVEIAKRIGRKNVCGEKFEVRIPRKEGN